MKEREKEEGEKEGERREEGSRWREEGRGKYYSVIKYST